MSRIIRYIAALALFSCFWLVGGLSDAQELPPQVVKTVLLSPKLYLPEKPQNRIADEAKVLTPEQMTRLSALLMEASEKDRLDLYVHTRQSTPPIPENEFFGQLTKHWATGKWMFGVCYFSLDTTPFPILRAGGQGEIALGKSVVAQIATRAGAKARAQTTPGEMIETSINEFVSGIRRANTSVLGAGAVLSTAVSQASPLLSTPDSLPSAPNEKVGVNRYGVVGLVLVPVAVIAGVWLLAFRSKEKGALLFPEVVPRYRFAAPYSGGNNARVDFRAKKRRTK